MELFGEQKWSARFLPKLVANVDHWIGTLERFTLTKEFSSMSKVFQGAESILEIFLNKTQPAKTTTPKPTAGKLPIAAQLPPSIQSQSNRSTVVAHSTSNETRPMEGQFELIKQQLPAQILGITSSLNGLFPWHIWPWNNKDLYSTIDTFLSHGIFAFTKTTVGPDKRIDKLPDMLRTLFESFKYDSFPRKCSDWSQIICDNRKFLDTLALKPIGDEATEEASKERSLKIDELSNNSQYKQTQEMTCIMFSSLSMQQFGAIDKDILEPWTPSQLGPSVDSLANNRLSWDKQVLKGIKLYSLAREALNDEQWLSLYNLIQELWSQQRIPDRIIMVSRVIQLLTNCHMPKEILESALWKDIYKYKNVLNQLLDLVVDECNYSSESGKLAIEQLSLGSKSLQVILEKFLRFLPHLIESLSRTITDELPELVGKFFSDKQIFFKVPCKGNSLSDIIPSLRKYRTEVVELETLVCKQLKTKPNITMMQIHDFTNDFLAMALNFSNIGNSLSFPKLYTDPLEQVSAPPLKPATSGQQSEPPVGQNVRDRNPIRPGSSLALHLAKDPRSDKSYPADESASLQATNVSSIIDEMASNPKMAQIMAILQSSALDPPEVHAVLPELDWVEAGTSIARLYESIQRLMSYEQVFVIFPEIENFQDSLGAHTLKSREMFRKFSKRDPIRLVAYSLDTVMPIALRTFRPGDSLNSECLASLREIFSEFDIELTAGPSPSPLEASGKVAGGGNRQWQCFVSGLNFVSWASNELMINLNRMFKNLINHMGTNVAIGGDQLPIRMPGNHSGFDSASIRNDSCILLDGSVGMMLDNLPQFIDLALETVLMASTSSMGNNYQQQLTLHDILCSSNYVLDPFDEQSIELRARMKTKMCHLFYRKSYENCAVVLGIDEWKSTLNRLNYTWFETNALNLNPSFRDVTLNVHKLLELFGQFKPSTMSDSLIAKVLNVNSYWGNLSTRIMNIIDKYQEKRFEYALQTLTPIIYDNIPKSSANLSATSHSNQSDQSANQLSEIRETLTVTILGANAVLSYLNSKQSATGGRDAAPSVNSTGNGNGDQLQEQIQILFDWADQCSMLTAETVLITMANNITSLENVFKLDSSSSKRSRLALDEVWHRFCSAPIDQYLNLKPANRTPTEASPDEEVPPSGSAYSQMKDCKEVLCRFRWHDFYFQLGANSTHISKSLLQYPESQLTRIALTRWGQVLDAVLIESKHIKQLPKFFYMSYWQEFKDKLPQITPHKEQPSNLIWIWQGFERIVSAIDSSGNNQTVVSLFHILDQLNCGLDAVKGGLSWDNIANIYQDKQDILAVHSTINNGFALASIVVDTVLTQHKFQKFLDEFIRPHMGSNFICEARNRTKLEALFAVSDNEDLLDSLESIQELICDTTFESLARNINPISVCYEQAHQQLDSVGLLANTVDRFFKLASLAILDAKLIAANDVKPPLLDKNQWSNFWSRWTEAGPQDPAPLDTEQDPDRNSAHARQSLVTKKVGTPSCKRRVSLAIFRAFQVIDTLNSDSPVWDALFKATHELCEVVIYLERVVLEQRQARAPSSSLVELLAKETGDAGRPISGGGSNGPTRLVERQQLVSVVSNILFPEINNFISYRTFKQLRYMRTSSEYFLHYPAHYQSICSPVQYVSSPVGRDQLNGTRLIGWRQNSGERLPSLLCHNDPSQWLHALDVATSTSKSSSISRKVNLMTRYVSLFMRNVIKSSRNSSTMVGEFEKFKHSQQLDDIGTAINTTVAYLLTTTDSLQSMSFCDLTNISWRSLPNLFDSIDRHLCSSKFEPGRFVIASYEPKRIRLETIMCTMPHWNITQVYDYFSETFDLHNMISLIAAQQQQEPSFKATSARHEGNQTQLKPVGRTNGTQVAEEVRTCATPFKFASRWLKMGQELASDFSSKESKAKAKKCMGFSRRGMSPYSRILRYVKIVNSLTLSLNDLTRNNSWLSVKKTWSSFRHLLLDQTASAAHLRKN